MVLLSSADELLDRAVNIILQKLRAEDAIKKAEELKIKKLEKKRDKYNKRMSARGKR
ncbi:MAG: hypothetical protein ACRCX8_00155 [Sarcina sp.]